MPRKVMKATTILFLLLVLVAASEILLPKLISEAVVRTMTRQTNSETVSAKAHSSPAIYMLAGKFDEIRIQTTKTKIDKAVFSEMQAVLKNVQLDIPLLTSGQLAVKSVDKVELTAVISQEELARIISANVKGLTQPKVIITQHGVKLMAVLALGQLASVTVDLEGRVIAENQKIKLITEKFALNNAFLGNIAGKMLADILLVDVKNLPFGVTVKNIATDDGRIIIFADNLNK